MKLQSVLAAALLFSANAQAQELLQFDLDFTGDGLVTYDTETHLEWLDVVLTDNVAFNQVSGTIYADLGFRHATDAEVRELLAHSGITVAYRPQANYAPILRLLQLLGPPNNSGTYLYVSGVYKSDSSNPVDAGWLSVSVGVNGPDEGGQVSITTDTFTHAGEPLVGTGNFLVRKVSAATLLQRLRNFSTFVGTGKVLINKVGAAQTSFQSTCIAVQDFAAQVAAWKGTKMTIAQAVALTGNALVIKSALGCE